MAYAHHARIETNQTAGVGVSTKPGGNLLPLPPVRWEGESWHGYEEGGSATKKASQRTLVQEKATSLENVQGADSVLSESELVTRSPIPQTRGN